MAYPILTSGPELLKARTKDDEIKELYYKTEKYEYEKILKSLEIFNNCYRENKSVNGKKKILKMLDFLLGPSSTIASSTLSIINPNIGIPIPSSSAQITSTAILITNERFWKLNKR